VKSLARLRLATVAAFVTLAATARAIAQSEAAGADDAPLTADPGLAASADADDATAPPARATFAVPAVDLTGGANGSLAATGEAWTVWRYGAGPKGPVDETTTRLRVSGSGRSLDGLLVGFSVAQLVPGLTAGATVASSSLAAAWARRDRVTTPDIEWESTSPGRPVAGARPLTLTLGWVLETSHTAERRGGVIVDTTHYRLHGTLDAVLPCKRSVLSLRPSCRPESIHGTF
jgi:hypothetical protein